MTHYISGYTSRTKKLSTSQVSNTIPRQNRSQLRARRRGIGVADLADRDRAWTGRGGKRFRKAVAGLPTARFGNRMCAEAHRSGIGLYAVNPAYSSAWGDRHWRAPDENVTRPQAAATVIGRRAQDFRACR